MEELDKKFKKGLEEIRAIRMTAGEKSRILERVSQSPKPSPYLNTSPYWKGVISFVRVHRALTYVLPALFILILGGGGVLASERSLPGNFLYPIKVNFVEPVRGAFIFSPEKKEEYKIKLSEERITEAEMLLKASNHSQAREEKIDRFLSNNAEALDKSLENVRKKRSASENRDDRETNFEVEMRKRYERKRDEVKSVIENNVSGEVLQDLENARKFFDEAEDKRKKGEDLNAYSKLLDLEKSLRIERNRED